jgi:CRP-like cAMP-binding protein
MPASLSPLAENRLLSLLPREEYHRVAPWLDPVSLKSRQVLYEIGVPIRYSYFPRSGVLSCLVPLENGVSAEVATVGNEGMTGIRPLLGAETMPAKVVVQVPGQAWRMPVADMQAAARRDSPFSRLLYRYMNVFLTQVTQSVACNTFHPLARRLCRWLLMTHDRVHSDQFPLTHELLARMLGVRRASVSEVASKLQDAGIIRYIHGKITVVDRRGLEAASCECYRAVKSEFDNLLG